MIDFLHGGRLHHSKDDRLSVCRLPVRSASREQPEGVKAGDPFDEKPCAICFPDPTERPPERRPYDASKIVEAYGRGEVPVEVAALHVLLSMADGAGKYPR